MSTKPTSSNSSKLRESAERMLAAMEAKRANRAAIAAKAYKPPKKPKKEKATARGALVDQVVSKAAQQHGIYEPVDFVVSETVDKNGNRKMETDRVVRNLASTTVERWAARGILDDRQRSAILFYQAAWRAHIGEPRVVANYEKTTAGSGAIELWTSSQIRAKEALRYLDVEVFYREPVEWVHIWQNVVIWDEPAGMAGGRLGYSHKGAEAAARIVVLNLADKIATAIDDARPQEWSDLLAQLDADRARAPRGK